MLLLLRFKKNSSSLLLSFFNAISFFLLVGVSLKFCETGQPSQQKLFTTSD